MSQSSSSAMPTTPTTAPATTSATSDPARVALRLILPLNRPVISDGLSGQAPSVLMSAPQAGPQSRWRKDFGRVDRSFQTDARARPESPDVGAASGALESLADGLRTGRPVISDGLSGKARKP